MVSEHLIRDCVSSQLSTYFVHIFFWCAYYLFFFVKVVYLDNSTYQTPIISINHFKSSLLKKKKKPSNDSPSSGSSTQTGSSSTGSSSSQSRTGSLLLANIKNLVSVKLDRDNYLLSLSQFEPLLYCNDLYGLVDGTYSARISSFLTLMEADDNCQFGLFVLVETWTNACWLDHSHIEWTCIGSSGAIEHLFWTLEVSGATVCNSPFQPLEF